MSHEHMDHGDMAHAGCSDTRAPSSMPACRGWAARKAIAFSDVLWEKCGYCSLLFHSPPLTEDACLALFSVPSRRRPPSLS
ncbi:hypothetical protein P4233_01650 [Pseudomonas aeruginosa]|nr:hypothetical protein [Pseudomonas aeruginosa]